MFSIRKFSWYQSLGLALAVFVLARGPAKAYALTYLPLTLLASLLFWRYLADWSAMREQYAKQSQARSMRFPCLVFIPPFFYAVWRYNRAACQSWWALLSRRSAVSTQAAPQHGRFGYLQRGQYHTVFLIILIAMLAEIPFSALMVALLPLPEAVKQQAHVSLLLLSVYSLFLLIADRQQLQHSQHQLLAEHLALRVAERFSADIPYHLIEDVHLFKQDKRLWCVQHKWSMFDCQQVSPADAANVLVMLKAESQTMQSFKLQQALPRYLFIYVDEPGEFVRQLQLAIAGSAKDYAEHV